MNKRYQNGSLAGFIVVGVLLTLVLVGGLYGLNRYNAQKTADTAASDDKTTEKPAEVAKGDANKSEKQDNTPTKQPAAPAPSPEEQSDDGDDRTPSTGTQAPQPAADSSDLPQTGPADVTFSMIAVTALSFATMHYIRSRA